MKDERTPECSAKMLHQELAGCRITKSPLFPDFDFEKLMNEVIFCRIIKDSIRRQIFYLQNPRDGYYLKRSTLVRSRDRRRHALLPFRKGAEWRNLHRLLKLEISAAKPVVKGKNTSSHPKTFFLLTEKIDGLPPKLNAIDEAEKIGRYIAILHSHGVIHADLHQDNIIVNPPGRYCLIDVQEVFFLPWIPHRLRVHNIGKIYFNMGLLDMPVQWSRAFLAGYNHKLDDRVTVFELLRAARHHQNIKYRSRSKRCCRDSSEFVIVNNGGLKGYKRKSFHWGPQELRQALKEGKSLKGSHVISYQGLCIKKQLRRPFHKDRCLTSWKMSRALEVRGIAVPRSLAYFKIDRVSYFVSELLDDRYHLNTYLSSINDEHTKRRALKRLALWLHKFYSAHVWQRDFKSSNILCRHGEYYMVDLDGVKIRRLSEHKKIVNLAQLNASVSNAVTIKDRLRFYHYLTASQSPSRQQRREAYRKVWNITREKNTSIYDLDIDKLWKPGR